jgi:predicted PurR-regulated permease PerM
VTTLPPERTAQVMSLARWLLIAIFVVLGWLVVSFLASVLAPILAALVVAYLLNPVLERMVARGTNRTLGAALLLVAFVAAIAVTITILAPRLADQVAEFAHDLPRMADNLSAWAKDKLGIELPSDWKQYVTSDKLQDSLKGPLEDLATYALGGVFHLLAVMAELLLVPVFTFYFLADWPNLIRRIEHMIPPRRRHDVREIAREIDNVVSGWVRGQAIATTILAICYAIGFTIVGMPLSLPIGLLVGALTVVPFVGTFVGATIAALVTIADGGSLETLALVGVVILCLHLLEAAVLTPKIVGHRVGLSESGALFAVVAGGKLLGFVGVVLAVPLAATTAVLVRFAVRYYEHTDFFGRESDADVVITPAMAMIMPGIRPGTRVVGDGEKQVVVAEEPEPAPAWAEEPELGEAGAPTPPPDTEEGER